MLFIFIFFPWSLCLSRPELNLDRELKAFPFRFFAALLVSHVFLFQVFAGKTLALTNPLIVVFRSILLYTNLKSAADCADLRSVVVGNSIGGFGVRGLNYFFKIFLFFSCSHRIVPIWFQEGRRGFIEV